jgi:hypothetical protein
MTHFPASFSFRFSFTGYHGHSRGNILAAPLEIIALFCRIIQFNAKVGKIITNNIDKLKP